MLEASLIHGLAYEDSASFELILRSRQPLVLRTAYRILGNWADAEEVAQEVFLKLHRRGVGFANEAALGGWLYRVTVNLCFDRARAARSSEELPQTLSQAAAAEAGMIREQEKQRLMAALKKLPVKERAAVVLREIEGLTTAEAAAALGSTEGTVRSQIFRAMAKLRELLGEERR
jgi:RNA polymerase sigma-70 factor, ECF subfamily